MIFRAVSNQIWKAKGASDDDRLISRWPGTPFPPKVIAQTAVTECDSYF